MNKKINTSNRNDKNKSQSDGCQLSLARDNSGMGTVEVILIIVVLVGLVIIFQDQITQIVNSLFEKIVTRTGRI